MRLGQTLKTFFTGLLVAIAGCLISSMVTALAIPAPQLQPDGTIPLNLDKHKIQLLPMRLETALSSYTASNTPVVARLILPVKAGNQLLPVNSRLQGVVTTSKPGERFGRRARLGIQWQAWCPPQSDCQPIPPMPLSQYPSHVTGTSGSAFKRFVPLQLLSLGVSIPLGLTAMPLWSTMFIEQGVGAIAGATFESIHPEDPDASRTRRVVRGALNSTSLPTITRFVKKAPDIKLDPQTPIWMPVETRLITYLLQQP